MWTIFCKIIYKYLTLVIITYFIYIITKLIVLIVYNVNSIKYNINSRSDSIEVLYREKEIFLFYFCLYIFKTSNFTFWIITVIKIILVCNLQIHTYVNSTIGLQFWRSICCDSYILTLHLRRLRFFLYLSIVSLFCQFSLL